jgi:hypothetical protein
MTCGISGGGGDARVVEVALGRLDRSDVHHSATIIAFEKNATANRGSAA